MLTKNRVRVKYTESTKDPQLKQKTANPDLESVIKRMDAGLDEINAEALSLLPSQSFLDNQVYLCNVVLWRSLVSLEQREIARKLSVAWSEVAALQLDLVGPIQKG